jgi:hypothetical protein
MLTVVVQNQTATALALDELCVTLGALGSANDSITFSRTQAQLDAMPDFQALMNAGSITAVSTQSAGNSPLFSIPSVQRGKVLSLATDGPDVTGTVTFGDPYPAGVYPVVVISLDQTGSAGAVINDQVRSITNTGFTYYLDITGAGGGGETVALHWVAVY